MLFPVAAPAADALGVPNPAILPDGVRQFSCLVADVEVEPMPWALFDLPADLRTAAPARQRQFRAGRFCAAKAIRALDPHRAVGSIARGPSGAPRWPDGVTGSITHAGGFVSAAVARTSHLAALGIDTEPVMSPAQARDVSLSVAWACEVVQARHAGCDRLEALTLVFSAKESIFKCLSDSVGFFDFRDVRIVDVDARTRTFTARLVRTLSSRFPAQTLLQGRFEIDGPWVHTGIAQEADA